MTWLWELKIFLFTFFFDNKLSRVCLSIDDEPSFDITSPAAIFEISEALFKLIPDELQAVRIEITVSPAPVTS